MLTETLKDRIHPADIHLICRTCSGTDGDSAKEELYALIYHADIRVSYNALWTFTHFSKAELGWLRDRRDELIDLLLTDTHVGKRRLILTLLEHQSICAEDLRTDYLDFCLSKINSTEPYAIRALCLKQAFAQCRLYPELLSELMSEIDLMEYSDMSPGLISARKNVLRQLSRLKLQGNTHHY